MVVGGQDGNSEVEEIGKCCLLNEVDTERTKLPLHWSSNIMKRTAVCRGGQYSLSPVLEGSRVHQQ